MDSIGILEQAESTIPTTIDLNLDGKQLSYLSFPNSHAFDGGSRVLIPIVVIKNGAGPSILLTGGNHGDEFEGPITLLKLIQTLDPKDVRGRIVALPYLNAPAVIAGQRCSPVDGRNLNRVFPGRAHGTMSEAIAHHVTTQILPHVDAVIDLHAGGRSSFIIPSVMMHYLEDSDLMARTEATLNAFQAPVSVIIHETDTEGMFDTTAERLGKIFVCAELGGAGVVTPETMSVADAGVRNVLIHHGLLEGKPVTPGWHRWPNSRRYWVPAADHYLEAPVDGLFEPLLEIGDVVEKNMPIARVYSLSNINQPAAVIRAKVGGVLFSRRAATIVHRGDNVGIVAAESAMGVSTS